MSLTLDPTAGRAAAAAAGHGFVPGWTLAIIGDMIYFVLLMASTLWVSSVVGDDRVTLGAVYLALDRLEGQGLLASALGDATAQRGGRAKRYFRVTANGLRAVRATQRAFVTMWRGIPELDGGRA